MTHVFLPLLISSLVFAGTWPVSAYIHAHKIFESQRHAHPRGRPALSRPIVVRR